MNRKIAYGVPPFFDTNKGEPLLHEEEEQDPSSPAASGLGDANMEQVTIHKQQEYRHFESISKFDSLFATICQGENLSLAASVIEQV